MKKTGRPRRKGGSVGEARHQKTDDSTLAEGWLKPGGTQPACKYGRVTIAPGLQVRYYQIMIGLAN